MIGIFRGDANGRPAVLGGNETFQNDPHWRDYIPFYGYFHGENGMGLAASNQTDWTGLGAALLQDRGERMEGKWGQVEGRM